MDIERLMDSLTLAEKAALVAGTDSMYTNPVPSLGIPSLCMADGPHGLRKLTGKHIRGIPQSERATAFPTSATLANGWNVDNAYLLGAAVAEECRHYGVHILLGPGVNIKLNPLCGRNFEYYSEDPLLAGMLAAAKVRGVQSRGVGVSVKHFALNNSENYRFMGDSVADARAMREIYLRVFERVVKESKPAALMCAYNKVNGTYASENKWLLTDVLRGQWGFEGAVMSDWGAVRDRRESLLAGLDLEMPGDTAYCRARIVDSVNDGSLPSEVLDTSVRRILRLVGKYAYIGRRETDFDAHNALAAKIAEDCAVLLKNDGLLPLADGETYLVCGELFEKMRYQGAGSSMITPFSVTSPKRAFDEAGVKYVYARGYVEESAEVQPSLIAEAVKLSEGFDKILIFAGQNDSEESEGGDRESICLPRAQLTLINALIKTGKRLVIVLYGGSVMELPFADEVGAILYMALPGQNGGKAAQRLLFGRANPSGRLSESWVYSYSDVPGADTFGKAGREVYRHSIFVGYRYYLTAGKKVRYPFGYGLSYTEFSYDNMSARVEGGKVYVACDVINIGKYDGSSVVQLYSRAPSVGVPMPTRELRAFRKVFVPSGGRARAELSFELSELSYFNVAESRFVLASGEYALQLCSDAQTVLLTRNIAVSGETLPSPYPESVATAYSGKNVARVTDSDFEALNGKPLPPVPEHLPITTESRFTDLSLTVIGRLIYSAVIGFAERQLRAARRLPAGEERDNRIKGAQFMKRILQSGSLRSMSMSAGKAFPYNLAQGAAELANGRLIGGLRCFFKPVKAPPLPKNEKIKKSK